MFTSFAVVASTSAAPFIRPQLKPKGSGILSFEKLRHPCVENQPGITYIPNDISFLKGGFFNLSYKLLYFFTFGWLLMLLTRLILIK